MTASAPHPSTYTIRGIQEMLGLSRGVIAGLIASGFVTPSRGARNEYRFTFRDVVVLRTAVDLQAARIPPRRILAAIDEKIAGKQIVAHAAPEEAAGGAQVIDLVEALRASLSKAAAPAKKAAPTAKAAAPAATPAETSASGKERKGVKRAAKVEEAVAPARARARK